MPTDYHHYWTGKTLSTEEWIVCSFIENSKCLSLYEYLYKIDDKFLQVIY